MAQLREAMRLTRKIFAAPAFSQFLVDERLPGVALEDDAALDEYIRHCERRMVESHTDEDDPSRCFRRRQRAYGTQTSLVAYAERLGLKRNRSRPLPD